MVVVQESAFPLTTIRCPSCGGLRSAETEYLSRYLRRLCRECSLGRVVPSTRFHNYWTARFSMEEICDMAKGIWG
jgi:hypothetical protein